MPHLKDRDHLPKLKSDSSRRKYELKILEDSGIDATASVQLGYGSAWRDDSQRPSSACTRRRGRKLSLDTESSVSSSSVKSTSLVSMNFI